MDLSKLSPSDIEDLRNALGVNGPQRLDANGRSPYYGNRVFKDLNVKPSATDPRPLFVWSADSPIEFDNVQHEFPKLMWSKDGTEITVRSQDDQEAHLAQGYVLSPPANAKPFDILAEQFASMSDEDKKFLFEQQRVAHQSRLATIAASLTDEQVAQLVAMNAEKKPKAKTA